MAFAPVFPRTFPGTFDRHAPAAAVAVDWWPVAGKTCVAAYQPKGAASLAASYVNLANPGTYDAAPGTAPGFVAATGWTFDGSTQWLKTGINVYSQNIQTILFRHANWIDGYTGSYQWRMTPYRAGNQDWVFGNEIRLNYTPGDGVMGQAGEKCYKNGLDNGTDFSPASPSRNIMIGAWAWELNSIDGGYAAGDVLAWAAWSDVLTAGEVATVSAAMAAL